MRKTEPDIIASYLEDSSNLTGGHAEGVYLPENEKEICEAATECNARQIPLTISGGETGTTGGCIPFGGWILSTQKLNKILDVNKNGKYAIVQPGVTLEEIENAVKKEGLLYPPDPTEKTATIGGNIATNASGGRCYRFGPTRNYIRRLRIVLPSGASLNIKRGLFFADRNNEFVLPHLSLKIPQYSFPAIKNAAGYFSKPGMDFLDLFIGQEGTLGIIAEAEISLLPLFQDTFDIVAFFSSEELALDFIFSARDTKDPTINCFEFFDKNTLEMLRRSYPNIPPAAKAACYIEQEINEQNENTYLEAWGELLEKFHASLDDAWLGIEQKQKESLKDLRHAIPEHINELFKQHHMVKLATDIAVPSDKFREMYNYYESELAGSNLFYIKFGHIGENHLHVNILPDNEKDLLRAKEIAMRFVKKAVTLGGTVSAEHGIGKIKHPYLKEMYGDVGISEMVRVKKSFDPNGILDRGNIFPEELL